MASRQVGGGVKMGASYAMLQVEREVLRLAACRVPQGEIACSVGRSVKQIEAIIQAAKEDLRREIRDSTWTLIAQDLLALRELERAHMSVALSPEHPDRFRATDRVLAVQERRARLLGLDSPTRTDMRVTSTVLTEEQLALVRERVTEEERAAILRGDDTAVQALLLRLGIGLPRSG